MSTLVVPTQRKSGPTDLPDFDGEWVIAAADRIFRVLVPILLRPEPSRAPDYEIVADLTARWLARVEAASRRARMWDVGVKAFGEDRTRWLMESGSVW
ncbi:MAG: hypothetical protein P8099_20555 [Gemmatimonadota bacterium]